MPADILSVEAICASDCTSGCHASDCEHHGTPASFRCVVCGAVLLEERQFCANCEPLALGWTRLGDDAADNPDFDGTDGAHPAWWSGYAKGKAEARRDLVVHAGCFERGTLTAEYIAEKQAEAVTATLDALAVKVEGVSLPPGPNFAWVDGHTPFIKAVLALIDEARR